MVINCDLFHNTDLYVNLSDISVISIVANNLYFIKTFMTVSIDKH